MNLDIYARDTLDDIKSDSGHKRLLVQTLLKCVVSIQLFYSTATDRVAWSNGGLPRMEVPQ